ncbi:hypothetical protein D3C74_124800 [compost metagenome]
MQHAAGVQGSALGHGILDLLVQGLCRLARGQRGEGALGFRHRVAGLQPFGTLGQFGNELVIDVFHDDHALVRVAGLAGVVDAVAPSRINDAGYVIGVQDNKWIRAAQLQYGLLQVAAGLLADNGASALRTSQRDTLDPGIGDDG